MKTYRLHSAKGEIKGSLLECIAAQREQQGSFAEIAVLRGESVLAEVSVDDAHIDWDQSDNAIAADVAYALSLE